ncbi:hypothetical protein [Sphingobium sp. WCS2017Hpa-17]|uniref:hypothetical protein n=1 Tax=Sphingobium sp. WCS2017Hpa-17 TaxID=3073638 RepID=UPI00288BCA2B|nr:hypothetical protein [Sphingobium sp. WCS2017Hpa-17]
MESFLAAPLRYLRLRSETGRLIWLQDIFATFVIVTIVTVPFIIVSKANFIHKDGFVDKIGSFSSVLTGFYVAGLVAVATFPRQKNGLDATINYGKIKVATKEGWEYLTRREYICSLFGYLSTISLCITVFSIIAIIITSSMPSFSIVKFESLSYTVKIDRRFIRFLIMIIVNIPICHLAVSTFRGLYYLIDRMYAQSPVIKDKPED